ncbi:MAG: SIMPL domain-containing protein [Candidatus Krumholzibacteriia bacterium]
MLFALVAGAAITATAAGGVDRRVVVVGIASRAVVPDIVVWTVTVTTEDPDLQVAKRVNDERISAVLDVAETVASSHNDIETGPVRIERRYARNDLTNMREFTHFRIERKIKITQQNFEGFEKVLNELVMCAEVELSYYYEVSGEPELYEELRLLALDHAKAKAKSMVERLDSELGQVVEINELSVSRGSWTKGDSPPPKIDRASPEERTITVSLSVTFEIE